MKLHAFDLHLTVAQAHDDAVGRGRGNLQAIGERFALDDEGLVATGLETIFGAVEDGLAVVANLGGLAVHERGRTHDSTAEDLPDGLMAETHAEDGNPPGEVLYQLHRDASVFGSSGPRRDQNLVWTTMGLDLRDRHLVVAAHVQLLAKLAQVLHEVVSERVVVVDDEDDGSASPDSIIVAGAHTLKQRPLGPARPPLYCSPSQIFCAINSPATRWPKVFQWPLPMFLSKPCRKTFCCSA